MSDFSSQLHNDETLLAQLMELECQRLRRSLSRRIPRAQSSVLDVDDVLQQTCIDAFRTISLAELADEQAFSAWFETIARRNLIDAVRSLNALKRGGDRRPLTRLDASSSVSSLLSQLFMHSVTASRLATSAEALDRLKEAIAALPPHYRTVVERYDLQQQTIEQAAQAVGKTIGAAFMIRSRAHRLLAETLGSTAAS